MSVNDESMTSKPTLMLLPGLICDRAVWQQQLAPLSAHAHCVVPDYGQLDSLAAMAQRVLQQAPAQFMIAGHSMGGRVALEIMRTAPQRVPRLVLLDTGYQARSPGNVGDAEKRQRQHLLEIASVSGMRAAGREWVQGMVHADHLQNETLIESILAMIERHTPQTFAAQVHALLNRPDATAVLSTITCPTLLLCGRQDAWSPLSRHEQMATLIPGSVLEVIEHSGHMTTMEQPAQVSAVMMRWLFAS